MITLSYSVSSQVKLFQIQLNDTVFDRELLGIFKGLRHYRHAKDGRQLTIFTEHLSLTFKPLQFYAIYIDRLSPHPEYIDKFTSYIRFLADKDKTAAYALT